MTEILLSFARTNDAIKAEDILLAAGIPTGVMSLPSAIRGGCGICLRVPPEKLVDTRAALRESGVAVAALHIRAADGTGSTYTPLET